MKQKDAVLKYEPLQDGKLVSRWALVLKAIDGDTLEVLIREYRWCGLRTVERSERVRLAYIDTKEKGQNLYKDAKAYMQKLEGRWVRLQYQQQGNKEWRGDFGRILVMIRRKYHSWSDNINRDLVWRGLAKLYEKPDRIAPQYEKALQNAQLHAQRWRKGIWKHENSSWQYIDWLWCSLSFLAGIAVVLLYQIL